MTICLQYARPASGQGDGEIFGLDVAVTNFLKAWFRFGRAEQFICRPADLPSFEHFKALASEMGVDAEKRCIGLDPRHPKQNLESITCLFRPDPLTADLTWRRQQLSGQGFATCGLVHTMSGERIAAAVNELCLAPSDRSDALVCPSIAVRDAVRSLWDIYSDYLGHRFGTRVACPVQTPVIPLGVDTERCCELRRDDKRAAQRSALEATNDEVILLFVGRLSFATKAHPLALWQAAEKAAQQTKKPLRVVMYGYFKPKDMETHFRALAGAVASKVAIDFVMNDDKRFPDGLWAAADIFASLSDNVQESFGLTPIEAMAGGLPTIITDWNGYKGSVRHGLDGFLIPTFTPPATAGLAIAERYYNENNYGVGLTGASQSTAVDIDACALAIAQLVDDVALRQKMGASARGHAESTFAWRHVIKAYEDLWESQRALRKTGSAARAVPNNWPAVHPSYPNPWTMFASFPTRELDGSDRMRIVKTAEEVDQLITHEMNYFIPELLVDKLSMIELINAIRRAEAPTMSAVVAPFPEAEHPRLWRCIGWILKHGIGHLVPIAS